MSDLMSPEDIAKNMDKFGESTFDKMAKAGDFLPRLQLMTGKSNAVSLGQIGINEWGLVISKDKIVSVGKEVDVCVLAWRPKAVRIDKQAGKVLNYYGTDLPEFQKIISDSSEQDSGCFFGPEFLVWVPKESKFATLLFGSKSARSEASNMKPLMGKAATLKSKLIETAKYKWQSPVVLACTNPISVMPDQEDVKVEYDKFVNTPSSSVETVEEGTAARDR